MAEAGLARRTEYLRLDEISKCIVNCRKVAADEAKSLAEYLRNFFGYTDRILDNRLEPEDRDVFYWLEETSIVTGDYEETHLYDGRPWRIFTWTLNRKKILSCAATTQLPRHLEEKLSSVYEGEAIWREVEAAKYVAQNRMRIV